MYIQSICIRLVLFCVVFGILSLALPGDADDLGAKKGAIKNNPRDGAAMSFIPGGEFTMGSNDVPAESPAHKVRLTRGYWMYRTLVTVGQYAKFCAATGRQMPTPPDFNPGWKNRDHPIVNESWNDATAYCKWAGGRLPTEAQWERAARGPQGYKFPWGNTFDNTKLWSSKSDIGDAGGTCAVGKFPANSYGLYDMAGNVWEWCLDCYDEKYYSSQSAKLPDPVNKAGNDQTSRVMRGCSWRNWIGGNFRCSDRHRFTPDTMDDGVGFRCVVPIP